MTSADHIKHYNIKWNEYYKKERAMVAERVKGKPTICVDFDGVIHSYTSPWTKDTEIHDPPVPGAMEFLRRCTDHFTVCVLSTRSRNPLAVYAMQKWMIEHWEPEEAESAMREEFHRWLFKIEFPTEKPPAIVYIDDRAMLFAGGWPTVEEMQNFFPWNKRR